ncbi:hypothetical protein Srot_1618 [Segniliparus rotundus DSM 44985]|uniref:Uncharacterized protein n=2 Tax=Segniliparus rotundus TaxID=286802 RepID=D6Z7Z9_SEGRD|nr:hypothetical protein Srot_1618 [Segniliparus rotundus DSM 44985]
MNVSSSSRSAARGRGQRKQKGADQEDACSKAMGRVFEKDPTTGQIRLVGFLGVCAEWTTPRRLAWSKSSQPVSTTTSRAPTEGRTRPAALTSPQTRSMGAARRKVDAAPDCPYHSSMAPLSRSPRLFARVRFLAALAACAGPALAPLAAHADPQVPAGAICDAVAPSFGDVSQDEEDSGERANHLAQGLAKAQQIQAIMNRVQQNGGLTSGQSGADITAIMQAVPTGDLPTAVGSGVDLANTLRPQINGERQDGDEAPPHPAPQGKPLVDEGTLATAQKAIRQNCEILKANQNKSADDAPADDSSDESD